MADQDDAQAAMFQAIGMVAMDSGWASMALQQLAADVAGTDLTYFMLQDRTLGFQVGQVKAIVSATTTNEWISHPPIDSEMRTLALSTLAGMATLTPYRNRIVHDIWRVTPTEEVPDGLTGDRATRWGKTVESSRTTFYQISKMFFLVAATLNAAGDATRQLRDHDRDYLRRRRDDRVGDAERYHAQLSQRLTDLNNDRLDGWRWNEIPLPLP
jgi:hypothetical protein